MDAIQFFEQYAFWITAGFFFVGGVAGFMLGCTLSYSQTWDDDDEQPMRSDEYGESTEN